MEGAEVVQVISVALQDAAAEWLRREAQEQGKPLAVLGGELLAEAIAAALEKLEARKLEAREEKRATIEEKQLELWEIDKFNSHYNGGL